MIKLTFVALKSFFHFLPFFATFVDIIGGNRATYVIVTSAAVKLASLSELFNIKNTPTFCKRLFHNSKSLIETKIFLTNQNHLNNFGRGLPRDHSC